jgi:hypothetical protein
VVGAHFPGSRSTDSCSPSSAGSSARYDHARLLAVRSGHDTPKPGWSGPSRAVRRLRPRHSKAPARSPPTAAGARPSTPLVLTRPHVTPRPLHRGDHGRVRDSEPAPPTVPPRSGPYVVYTSVPLHRICVLSGQKDGKPAPPIDEEATGTYAPHLTTSQQDQHSADRAPHEHTVKDTAPDR